MLKLKMVYSSGKRLLIKPLADKLSQRFINRIYKYILAVLVRISRNDRELRLHDLIFVITVHLCADTCINYRLLKRRARCVQQCVAEDVKCSIQHHIRTLSDDSVVAEVSISLQLLILGNRIIRGVAARRIKALLLLDGRINFLSLVF